MTDITTRGQYQNNIKDLKNLETYDFENIFKMCFDTNKQAYFYNILKTVNIPNSINRELYRSVAIPAQTPLTALSFSVYGTMKLWWLICAVNNINNPVEYIPGGTTLKVIQPRHVPYIVDLIKQNLVD
jgi:hypothetical protein